MRAVVLSIIMVFSMNSHAGLFDIISGHASDIKSRFSADQMVDGHVIRSGEIRDDDIGQDFLHRASGTVSIVMKNGKYFIQLESNFTSTPGPDYHVYVSTSDGIVNEDSFLRAEQIELGRLAKGSGASFYEVSNPSSVKSVTIWCKQFGEFIGSADL